MLESWTQGFLVNLFGHVSPELTPSFVIFLLKLNYVGEGSRRNVSCLLKVEICDRE